MNHITIGTRASKLAMIQTSEVVARLHQHWPNLEIAIEQIRTHGDHITDLPLTQIGGDGVFVTEIEHALSAKRIDLAVHSLKDLPTAQPEGLRLVIIGPREDVRDVLVWNSNYNQREGQEFPSEYSRGDPLRSPWPLDLVMPHPELTAHLRIGTCSQRRTAQILALYPNAHILPLRGNVDTRLRKLDVGEYDAIVLAAAGLHRMGMQERLSGPVTYLPVEVMMPAPGQGALALEIRDEPEMQALVAPLNDSETQAATSAERTFMRTLGAGCYLPVAAYAELTGETLTLLGLVISLDGQHQVRVHQSMPWPPESTVEQAEQLGIQLAELALAEGAAEIIRTMNPGNTDRPVGAGVVLGGEGALVAARRADSSITLPLKGQHILVTRTPEQASALSERLRALGAIPIEFPTIRIAPPQDWEPLDSALQKLFTTDSRHRGEQTVYSRGDPLQSPWSPPLHMSSPSRGPYDWLIFTSVNGVNMSFERLRHLGYNPSALDHVRVGAIGPATAAALAQNGVLADLVPETYIAEGVVAALIEDASRRGESLGGKRVLLARAAEARKVLAAELQQAGAIVDEVAAYRTLPVTNDNQQGPAILRMLQDHQIDIVTFTSSSTVRNFMQWLTDCEQSITGSFTNLVTHDAHLKVACIGPITSQTARELGLDVHIEAKKYTIDGLIEAIVQNEEKTWQNKQP